MAEEAKIKLGLGLKQFKREIGRARRMLSTGFRDIAIGSGALAASGYGLYSLANRVSETSGEFESLRYNLRQSEKEFNTTKDGIYSLNKELGLKSVSSSISLLQQVRSTTRQTGAELFQTAKVTGLLSKQFEDTGEVVRAEESLMRSFGITAKMAGNTLLFLKQNGGDLKGELLEGVLEYSKDFESAGMNIGQTTAFIKAGLDKGWNFDKVGDMMKETVLRLKGGDKAAQKALSTLGLNNLVIDIQNNRSTVFDSIELIRKKFEGLNRGKQLELGKDIFGTQFEDVGEKAALDIFKSMRKEVNTNGELDRFQNDLQKRFSFKFDRSVSSALNNFSSALESLKPAILPVVETFSNLMGGIGNFAKRYPTITKMIGVGVIGFLSATAAIGGLTLAMGGFKLVTGGILGVFSPLKLALFGTGKNAGLLAKSLTFLKPIGLALISPFGLIGLTIAAVGVGLYFLEKKTGALSKGWEWLKQTSIELWERIKILKEEFLSFSSAKIGEGVKILNNLWDKLLIKIDKGWGLVKRFKDSVSNFFGFPETNSSQSNTPESVSSNDIRDSSNRLGFDFTRPRQEESNFGSSTTNQYFINSSSRDVYSDLKQLSFMYG